MRTRNNSNFSTASIIRKEDYMRKTGFTIIEVVVVFLLILGVTFLILPKSLDSTKQARFISKWNETYTKLEYMFSVISAQKDSEIKEKLTVANNDNARKKIILETIKPYLRITSEVKTPYTQYYMNGNEVMSTDNYHFDNFYFTSSNEIVGLKLINSNCKKKEICTLMTFDINGSEVPNKWGYDIFGINVLKNGIEPLGKDLDFESLKKDCSKYGFGLSCSYYYLIGGKFD